MDPHQRGLLETTYHALESGKPEVYRKTQCYVARLIILDSGNTN